MLRVYLFFYCCFCVFFFFSSRRRHTRCLSDWSSDVCSSDLVTKILLRRIVLHKALAAVNLHALLGGADGHLARVQLRDRRSRGRTSLAAVAQPRGAVREQARRVDPRAHVRELPADGLKRRNRPAELSPT